MSGRTGPFLIESIDGCIDAVVTLPGSKSITNRALVAAALAEGTSTLHGVLRADDTEAMLDSLRMLGVAIDGVDGGGTELTVAGGAGRIDATDANLDVRLSGTTARFIAALCALGSGRYRIDAATPMRARPMAATVDALRALGATVESEGEVDHLPLVISGGPIRGSMVDVRASASSQFLSGLLLIGPCLRNGLTVRVVGDLVSRPYVDMTLAVMAGFGADAVWTTDDTIRIEPTGYLSQVSAIEPDASAASYPLAAAAICGGRVRVEGLGTSSAQGDVAFVDILEQMGATVVREPHAMEVHGSGGLRGVTVDMADISDTAQTFAAVACFAVGPSEVTGIGFIRRKETDRIAAVVHELRRCGVDASETDDGFVVNPSPPQPSVIHTYDDHRMAMSFALIGLRSPGISIADPGCVAKTFPGYWDLLDTLRRSAQSPPDRVSDS